MAARAGLSDLPLELVEMIVRYLRVEDIKSLRASCRKLELFTFDDFFRKARFAFSLNNPGISDLKALAWSDVNRSINSLSLKRLDDRRNGRVFLNLGALDFTKEFSTNYTHLEGRMPLQRIERLLERLPNVATLRITDDIIAAPWTAEMIKSGPFLPQIKTIHVQISRQEAGNLCTLFAKCKNITTLTVTNIGSKGADSTHDPTSILMWSLEWLLRQEALRKLEHFTIDGGQMHLGHLSSIIRSLKHSLETIEITEVNFLMDHSPHLFLELFEKIEASPVFESLKIISNAIDCLPVMRNLVTAPAYKRWDWGCQMMLKRWLQGRRQRPTLHGWVEIRHSERVGVVLPTEKIHFKP